MIYDKYIKLEIDLTHSGLFVLRPVALPQTQVRFVPDSIDSRRLDLWTVKLIYKTYHGHMNIF